MAKELSMLDKLDTREIPSGTREIRAFIGIRNELIRLPQFLNHHRRIGVDRFFIMDNESDDGTREYVLEQPDCHCFHTEGSHFALNIWPPTWTNALMSVHGDGHWCVVVDGDELLVYPEYERVHLPEFCEFLEDSNANALISHMIDMYGEGPIRTAKFDGSKLFLECTPYFDPEPGWLQARDGQFPPELMFGGVRERAFWKGRFAHTLPPCLTKVPLVKWRAGMQYLVAQHVIAKAHFSPMRGAVLHFKFLTGFEATSSQSVQENQKLKEKTLEERQAYLEALVREPDLTLRNADSVRYRNSKQLIDLGWMKTSPEYELFASNMSPTSGEMEELRRAAS